MTSYPFFLLLILIYPYHLVETEQRCLKLGLLHEISSTPIRLHKTMPINADTRQVSLLANITLRNLNGINSKANSFVSSKGDKVEYRMRDVEVFKGEEKLNLAAYHCAVNGGKIVEIRTPDDKPYVLEVMKENNMTKIPIDLTVAKGTFYRPDGTYYDLMDPHQVSKIKDLQGNFTFLNSTGHVIEAVTDDLTGKVPLLCQKPLSVLRQNPGSSQAVTQYVQNVIGKVAGAAQVVQFLRDLPELPTGSVAALAGRVLKLVPSGRFMELFQLSKSLNTLRFWKNVQISDLRHLASLLQWAIGLKANVGPRTRLPLVEGNQIKDFINRGSDVVISDMAFTPSLKSSTPQDFLLRGNASFLEYSRNDLLRVSSFSPFVIDNKLILAAYLIEHQEVSYVTDKPPVVGNCGDDPCPISLDFTFEQASCAKFILGHALASVSHCKTTPVDFPVCYRTTCDNAGNMVCSSGDTTYVEVICRDRMTQTVRLPKGTHYSKTDCRLSYKGTTILDEVEDGSYFIPPNFPDEYVGDNTIKDLLLYSLTFLILGLVCCGTCGLVFTRPSVNRCFHGFIRCNGFCRDTQQHATRQVQGDELDPLNRSQNPAHADDLSMKSQGFESRPPSRQDLVTPANTPQPPRA